MKIAMARFVAALALLALAGCVVYDPYYPHTYQAPASFDRSWNAAMGAMNEQGVQINRQDRAAGMIEGKRGPLTVTARVLSQADGKVRVEFNTSGSGSDSRELAERISRSYDAQMGR